jgi:hypothetical protein
MPEPYRVTYFGGTGAVGEHVDGGTKVGFRRPEFMRPYAQVAAETLYFLISGVMPITNNSANCNLSAMKLAFNLAGTNVNVSAESRAVQAVYHSPLIFTPYCECGQCYLEFWGWNLLHSYNPTHTFVDTGIYTVMLIGTDSASCNIVDTAFLSVGSER